ARAGDLSRAVPVEPPIRLADVSPHQADALLDLDGDVRGVPIAEKKRLLEAYNGVMLAVSDRIVDTLALYRDEVREYWYVNSQGTILHELRPEITLSGTAASGGRCSTWETTARPPGCAGRSRSTTREHQPRTPPSSRTASWSGGCTRARPPPRWASGRPATRARHRFATRRSCA